MSQKLKLKPIALLVLSLLATPVVYATGNANPPQANSSIEEEDVPADGDNGADEVDGDEASGAGGGSAGGGANAGGENAGAGAGAGDGAGAGSAGAGAGGGADAGGAGGAGNGAANGGGNAANGENGANAQNGGQANNPAQGEQQGAGQGGAGEQGGAQQGENEQPAPNPDPKPDPKPEPKPQPEKPAAAAKDKTVSGAAATINDKTPQDQRAFGNLDITDTKMTVADTPVTITKALTIGGDKGTNGAALEISGKSANVTVTQASTISNTNPPAANAVPAPQLIIDKSGSAVFQQALTVTNSMVDVKGGGKLQLSNQGMTLNASMLKLDSGASLQGTGETLAPVTFEGSSTVDLAGEAQVKLGRLMGKENSITKLIIKDGSQMEVGKIAKLATTADAGADQAGKPADNAPAGAVLPAIKLPTADILVDGKSSVLSAAGLSLGTKSLITLSNGGTLKGEKVALTGADTQIVIGNKNAPGFLDSSSSIEFDSTHHGATQKLIFNHSDVSGNYVFGAKITGEGSIESLGGTTRLQGQTIAGKTTIDGGSTLILDRAKLSATTIKTGTLVYNSGSLGATTVEKGGRLAVGSKNARVNDTLTMQPGSQLLVTLGDTAFPDVAAVTAKGAATITGATLTVETRPGLELKTPYSIVEGTTLTGEFANVNILTSVPYLTGTMSYDGKKAMLTWEKTGSFSSVTTEPSAIAAAKSIDSLPATSRLYQHMVSQSQQSAAAALLTMSGDSVASVTSALQNVAVAGQSAQVPMRFMRQNLAAAMKPGAALAQTGGTMPMSALPSSTAMPLWAEAVGNWQRDNGSSKAPGLRANTAGLFIGGDHAITRDWRLGAALGYTHTKVDVNSRDADANVDNYSLSLYGGRSWMTGANRLNLMFGTAYTWHEIDSRRNMAAAGLKEIATARHDARTVQLFGELGYMMPLSSSVEVEPYVGLSWNKQDQRGYTETGSIAALRVQSQKDQTFTTTLGLRTRYQFDLAGKPAALRASAGWRHLSGDLTPQSSVNFSGGQPFGVTGNTLARSNALLEVGGDLRISDTSMLSLNYGGEFGAGTQQHQVSAVARWSF